MALVALHPRWLCVVFLLACGGSYSGKSRTGGTDAGRQRRGIEAAGLPYSVLDARTGRQLDTKAFWSAVASSRVVCVGEEHNNPHHHWFQLQVVNELVVAKRSPLALGMEMFQRPYQGVLDDYAARRIDEDALRSRSGYAERWGYDYGFYGPTINRARDGGATLLALNAPRELTKAVVRRGVEGLTPDEKAQMPELKLDDAQHRAWFDALMNDLGGGHGTGHSAPKQKEEAPPAPAPAPATDKPADKPADQPQMPSMDRIYTAQVVWDESMAQGAAAWAKANATGSLVLLAGNGHCHDTAIVGRVKRRGIDNVISIQPVIDGEGRVAAALAKPMNDYLVVLEMPK
jgi:uncharacterized iron-regulated protein